ncbi:SDR family oxidoreductase, partial [Acinetobacter haemolyticus]
MENKQTQFNQFQIALVAGATGFIGRFLIAELLSQGHQVFALVRDRAKQQKDMENWLKNKNIAFDQLRFIQGDITQEDLAINPKDWEKLTTVNILYNASALFAWNLSMREGRKV